MKTYGVGVLGCGEVWQRHRLAFEHSQRLRCARVYDPAPGRAEEAAAMTGARVAASAEEVLTAGDVDIVAVLTPVFTHAEQVEMGAAAGKHFMLEKPMALTLKDGERIVTAIRQAGVKCYHPTIRALSSDLFEKLVEWTSPAGPLGPVQCAFYHLVAMPVARSAWMMDRTKCFPPAEYAPHVLDTFLTLTGEEPATVWCHAGNYARPVDQDDVTNLVITFRRRRYLQIDVHWVMECDWNAPGYVMFDIVCERGFLRHNWFSAEWYTNQAKGSFQSTRLDSGGQRWDHYHALLDAIETGGDVAPNELDGLRYVRILDAALRSKESGKTIQL